MTMEIIDFNPHVVKRRLSAEPGAKKVTESVSSLAPGRGETETVANDQDNNSSVETPESTKDLGEGSVGLVVKPNGASDPKRGELEGRSRIATVAQSQVPDWIPVEAATGCNLPYASYEIPIPLDLNMDFCIDVMMGQDTIVFMFVCGDRSVFCVCRG